MWPNEANNNRAQLFCEMQNTGVKKQQSIEDTNCLLVLWSSTETQNKLEGGTYTYRSRLCSLEEIKCYFSELMT